MYTGIRFIVIIRGELNDLTLDAPGSHILHPWPGGKNTIDITRRDQPTLLLSICYGIIRRKDLFFFWKSHSITTSPPLLCVSFDKQGKKRISSKSRKKKKISFPRLLRTHKTVKVWSCLMAAGKENVTRHKITNPPSALGVEFFYMSGMKKDLADFVIWCETTCLVGQIEKEGQKLKQ